MKSRTWLKVSIGGSVLLLFAVILWIAYSGRGQTVYSFINHVPGGDKTGHVALIAFLAYTFSWLTSFRRVRLGAFAVYLAALAVFIFITMEEFAQILSPNRTFDWIDLSCNYLGIAIASAACWLSERSCRACRGTEIKR